MNDPFGPGKSEYRPSISGSPALTHISGLGIVDFWGNVSARYILGRVTRMSILSPLNKLES
jgi:hypothetical protein